ncbi:hypothetical protein [Changpingibacter yushuensis]|uniref:hypothetical protein n=1 Tax=Changpingibacter yushuensis TaxID=2758440 RepID=UPI00165E2AD8|nr:hypothetical protein [Changpingibacter yushuensis]
MEFISDPDVQQFCNNLITGQYSGYLSKAAEATLVRASRLLSAAIQVSGFKHGAYSSFIWPVISGQFEPLPELRALIWTDQQIALIRVGTEDNTTNTQIVSRDNLRSATIRNVASAGTVSMRGVDAITTVTLTINGLGDLVMDDSQRDQRHQINAAISLAQSAGIPQHTPIE